MLAAGVVALYPAIAGKVVDRLGRGFESHLVAVYVGTLVGLFLVDTWARDRRLERLRQAAFDATRQAEGMHQRAEELRFVLDVAAGLDGEDGVESALLHALERLRERVGFATGYVYLRDRSSGRLARRGMAPLTARPSARALAFATRTLRAGAAAGESRVHVDGTDEGLLAGPIVAQGDVIGLIVLEGAHGTGEADHARLMAVADRLGAALNTFRLLEELAAKERALRQANRELRMTGTRLARTSARAEATAVGIAASTAIDRPTEDALEAARQVERDLPVEAAAAVRGRLRRLRDDLLELRRLGSELRELGRRVGQPTEVQVNDALVAAIDLMVPDLKRAGIEVRMALDPRLAAVRIDEGILVHLFTRALRNARRSLRRAARPRRLDLETGPYGEGVKVVLRDNSAGVGSGGVERVVHRAPSEDGTANLQEAVRKSGRELLHADLRAHGVTVETHEVPGEGRTLTICLRGARQTSAGSLL